MENFIFVQWRVSIGYILKNKTNLKMLDAF